jgi:CheY-like chemotaxis protein
MRQRVLIVEHDALQSNMLAGLLGAHGFDVGIASNGLEAIEKIRTEFYDVAIIDYLIPEVDGLAVARVITSLLAPGLRPSLVALTTSPEQLRERESEGKVVFDAVEQKPPSPASLLAAIRRCREAVILKNAPNDGRGSPADEPGRREHTQTSKAADSLVEVASTNREKNDKQAHVLLVDDDEQVTAILKSAFECGGFEVSVAHSGAGALSLIEANSYDAVVLDYQMPGMTGLAAAQSMLKAIRAANRSRLVAFTATPDSLTGRHRDSAALFDAVVGKSQGIPALLAAVRQCVEYKEWRAHLYQLSE